MAMNLLRTFIRESLDEMAAMPASMKGQAFYHGTGSEAVAQAIMRDGLKPPDHKGPEGALTPVSNKVYLTPDLKYAMIYALGAAMIGQDTEHLPKASKKEPYGYIFVVRGTELEDIQPDEDSVGEMVYKDEPKWLRSIAERILNNRQSEHPEPIRLNVNIEDLPSRIFDAYGEPLSSGGGRDYDFEEWLWDSKYNDPSWWEYDDSTLYDMILGGEYVAWAEAGKIIVDELDDEEKIDLINHGAHVAHEGSVQPSEIWRFHKGRDNPKLKPDGSNFFDVAERIA